MEIRIEPERAEAALVIEAPALTPEVEELARRLRETEEGPILGFRAGQAVPLRVEDITCFYAQDKGVFARDGAGEAYALKLRLYELEERLDRHTFVRISQSEIVNLKKVTALDLKFSGTIKLSLSDGTACYASRRYVKKIKQALGL